MIDTVRDKSIDMELWMLDLANEIKATGNGSEKMDELFGKLFDAQLQIDKALSESEIGDKEVEDLMISHVGIGYTTDPDAC